MVRASAETLRVFFHQFVEKLSTELYSEWVHPPRSLAELRDVIKSYEDIGLPGCCGSTDCTHILWDRCPAGMHLISIMHAL